MKDYTHVLTEQIVGEFDKRKKYSNDEKVVISYGIELFLNSALKALIYMLIGISFHKFSEVVVVTIIFGIFRTLSGGIHAETDTGCFLLTGCLIMVAVISPYIFNISSKDCWQIYVICNFIYLIFAPSDEYYDDPNHHREKMMTKTKVIIMVNIFWAIGSAVNDYWRKLILATIMIQGITLLGRKKK